MLNYKGGWGSGNSWGPLNSQRSMSEMKTYAFDIPQVDPMDCFEREGEVVNETMNIWSNPEIPSTIKENAFAMQINYPRRNNELAVTSPEEYRTSDSIEICEMRTNFQIEIPPFWGITSDVLYHQPVFNAVFRFILVLIEDEFTDTGYNGGKEIMEQFYGFGFQDPIDISGWLGSPIGAAKWPTTKPFEDGNFYGEPPKKRKMTTLYDSLESLRNGAPNSGLDTVAESPTTTYPGDIKVLNHWAQCSIVADFKEGTEQVVTFGQLAWIVACRWTGPEINGYTGGVLDDNFPTVRIETSYKWRNLVYGMGTYAPGCYDIPIKPHHHKPKLQKKTRVKNVDTLAVTKKRMEGGERDPLLSGIREGAERERRKETSQRKRMDERRELHAKGRTETVHVDGTQPSTSSGYTSQGIIDDEGPTEKRQATGEAGGTERFIQKRQRK